MTTVPTPRLHHINFLTTRFDQMIEWYGTVLGMKVQFAAPGLLAFLTNDDANHRLALIASPALRIDPEKRAHERLHHAAFEYRSFEELNATYVRLRDLGITPRACLDHQMTFSYYYEDPDGNFVELQCDGFGDWAASSKFIRSSPRFAANPVGAFVDPEKVAVAHAKGMTFAEIREQLWTTTAFRPESFDLGLPPGSPPLSPPARW
jgi:catechol 2,3-dioxygenase-like lactoylglutathione lyase family enzyme